MVSADVGNDGVVICPAGEASPFWPLVEPANPSAMAMQEWLCACPACLPTCLPTCLPNGLPASTTGKKAHHKSRHYAPAAGLPIAGNIIEPGFLEGGDFFPMGQDLALVGVGLRSNVEACQQLMDRDLLGTRRLGVVRDDFDRHQVRPTSEDGRGQIGKLCSVLQFDSRLWAWGVDRRMSSRWGVRVGCVDIWTAQKHTCLQGG